MSSSSDVHESIVDKAAELVETRKFFETESLAEFCLVDRTVLEALYFYLLSISKVASSFDTEDRYFGDKDFQ